MADEATVGSALLEKSLIHGCQLASAIGHIDALLETSVRYHSTLMALSAGTITSGTVEPLREFSYEFSFEFS